MATTRITEQFSLETPIISAGMAFIAGPELTAAVSNSGGLGMLGGGLVPPEALSGMIQATKSLTDRPFGVDLIGDFVESPHIDVLIEESVPVVVFFWTGPQAEDIQRLKDAGIRFWMQVGSVSEAEAAAELGAEALIIQGSEGGGHNRAEGKMKTVFAAVKAVLPDMPLIAAGGIKDGQTMADALTQGADAVWCGTRFLASKEANAHGEYKNRVLEARKGDTMRTTLFGPEWPGQMCRVLKNEATTAGHGRVDEALAESAGETVGSADLGGPEPVPVPKYSVLLPTPGMKADLDWVCLTAGECSADISSVEPAGEIVAEMARDADAILMAAA